jgi:DNA-binding GntR family transcriptional regulator
MSSLILSDGADGPVPPVRTALVDDVYESLKAWIMDSVRDAGVRANIDALARTLRVSPTPIREALARLEADGLVDKKPSRGYVVTPPLSAEQVSDLYQFRQLLEPWAAAQAASRCGDDDVRRLRDEIRSCASAPDAVGYGGYRAIASHDERFHDLVLELAGNEEVRRAFARTHCHLHLFRLGYGRDMGDEALDEHRAIVDAIASGAPDAAAAAMERHLRRSSSRVTAALGPR